jgi:hypothetical protein
VERDNDSPNLLFLQNASHAINKIQTLIAKEKVGTVNMSGYREHKDQLPGTIFCSIYTP